MKKATILLLLLGHAFLFQAQSRFSAGITFGPQINSMKITRPYTLPFPSGIHESGGTGLGYFAGAHLEYKINKDFFVRSGLNYLMHKQQYRISYRQIGNDVATHINVTIFNDLEIDALDLPLDLGYRIHTCRKKINVVMGLGGIAHFTRHAKSTSIFKYVDSEQEPGYTVDSKITAAPYSAVFFGGVEYQISKRFTFALEPFMKYTPNRFNLFQLQAKTKFETGLTCRLRFM